MEEGLRVSENNGQLRLIALECVLYKLSEFCLLNSVL